MTDQFIEVAPAAKACHATTKIPASVTLAQWALESGFGKFMPKDSNNPFGIKATSGQPYVETWTHEVIGGVTKRVQAKFAKFTSLEAAFEAHAKLFFHPAYARAIKQVGNPDAFADALTGVYATDPHYGLKLIGLMKQYNLYQYDEA